MSTKRTLREPGKGNPSLAQQGDLTDPILGVNVR